MLQIIRNSLIAVALVSMCVTSSFAGIIPGSTPADLDYLVSDNTRSITVGDKIFDNFSYVFTGDMPGASGVAVSSITDLAGNYGIRFNAFFTDLLSSQGGSTATIAYRVRVLDANKVIVKAHIEGNVNGGNNGLIDVVETFLPLGVNGEFTMNIYSQNNFSKLVDSTTFDKGYKELWVQKDIGALQITAGPIPHLSFVDQTFEQNVVPEPSTVALMLIGAAGLGLVRRRKA